MQHVDEGQLHAYLDGRTAGRQEVERHLAGCVDCRARLEEERAVRDRARAILGAAGPAKLAAPPFEAVLERAARKGTKRSRVPPMVALAWAASLALAVTVGWYARSVVWSAAGEAAVAAGAAESEPTDVRASGIEATPPAAKQVAQADPTRAEAPPEQATRQPPTGAGAPVAAALPTVAPAVEDRVVANVAAAEAKGERDTAVAMRVAEAPAPTAARAATAAAPAPATRPAARETAIAEFAGQPWVTVTPAEAERRLGGSLATIPGLASLGTSVSGTGQATVARTLQVLGPGLTVELLQRRAAAPDRERAAAPAATLQAGRGAGQEPGQSVTVVWEGFSVTGRALVPADSLRRLLQSLRTAQRP